MYWFRVIIELTGLALGVLYLWFKHWQRVRNRITLEDPAKWTGHGIEALKLKPRVEQVRRDYLAARQVTRGFCFHRGLIGSARRAVIQLRYFRCREPEKQADDYGP